MASLAGNPSIIRFGLFELDLDSRELRKSGIRIKLQDQPFQILAMLLERPGEVVTREELKERLWPGDTFVDFDLSLNSAVKKLRQALTDDSDNPRYVETLYRRGYRFIGPVNGIVGTADSRAFVVAQSASSPPSARQPVARRAGLLTLLSAIFVLLVMAVFWLAPAKPIKVFGYTQITHDGRQKGGLVTDGERVYFNELDGDVFAIAQVSTAGGETSILPTPFTNVFIGAIAPDGSALLVSNLKDTGSSSAVWILPLPTGAPRRVGDLASVSAAAWSPHGTEVAFAKALDVYLANVDGTNTRKIASVNGPIFNLRFSPDGRTLRIEVTETNTASPQLWEARRDGKGLHRLLSDWNEADFGGNGSWTRDGKYYVFHALLNGLNDVWALPTRTRWWGGQPSPVRLTNGPLDFDSPVPSKDGKKIFMLGEQPRTELLRFDAKAGFVPYFANTSAIDLAFSADGQWVTYVSMPDFRLWRSRIDGSLPLQLTSSSMYAELPRWSPDGKEIVFMGRTNKTDYRGYLVSANGGTPRELIPGAEFGFDPGWSPDGKSIVLCLSPPPPPVIGTGISIVDLASKDVSGLAGSEGLFSPRWSPDGKYIAALSNDSETLMLWEVATHRWSKLAISDIGAVGFPSWSHDGQYLYFDTTFTADPGFYRMRISDHKLEKLFSLKGMRRFRGNFGAWTGLAPDDSPLLARDISSQEIYALDWETP